MSTSGSSSSGRGAGGGHNNKMWFYYTDVGSTGILIKGESHALQDNVPLE